MCHWSPTISLTRNIATSRHAGRNFWRVSFRSTNKLNLSDPCISFYARRKPREHRGEPYVEQPVGKVTYLIISGDRLRIVHFLFLEICDMQPKLRAVLAAGLLIGAGSWVAAGGADKD